MSRSNAVEIYFKRSDGREFYINKGDTPDWKIPSKGLEGFGDFTNDISATANAIGDGDILNSCRVGKKDRTIKAISRNKNMNDVLRREACSFFSPKYDYEVYLTYMGLTRWFEGKLHKYKLPTANINKDMELTLTFMSMNPYLKSYDNFGKNIAEVEPLLAFPFICPISTAPDGIRKGLTGGKFNFARMVTVENDGDIETYCKCVIEASAEVVNPKIMINDGYVRVLDTMQQNDVIEIDFTVAPPTVRKNGVNYVGHCDRSSTFDEMVIPLGDNTISFDADNGSNQMRVNVYYNKLYATI